MSNCPKCDNGVLDWILTGCEFKCNNCSQKFIIKDSKIDKLSQMKKENKNISCNKLFKG